MTRKPASSSAKSRPAKSQAKGGHKSTAKAHHKTKSSHAQAHALRTAVKHQARKALSQLAWLRAPLQKGLLKTFSVPKTNFVLPVVPTVLFIVVLGSAVGAGYWGAKSIFGASAQVAEAPASPQVVIQQTHSLRGVILPEPNGDTPHSALAYEEKSLEEVYAPPIPPAMTMAPEVASLPTPQVDVPLKGPPPLWMKNAVPFTPPVGAPMISIVIDDMGVDRKRSKHMWQDVSAPLTLSFMSYAEDLPKQTKAARNEGHELMLHMSMEPSSATIDAGPNVLLTAMPSAEIRSLTNWGLDRFEGFVGVNNHMGSRFTEDERGMRVVLEEINKRGLLFLDSRTSSRTVGPRVARKIGMPELERNVFLDNDNVPAKVLKQLHEVERLARKYGHVIAIGHPRDATIEVLKTWIPQAQERGLAIVPISVLMKDRLKRQMAQSAG